MDQPLLAIPLDLLQQLRLRTGARLEIVTTPDGLNRLDVFSNGKIVATFTTPSPANPIAQLHSRCAANAPTLDSPAGRRMDQWWDDDLLDEPLEPLAELKL